MKRLILFILMSLAAWQAYGEYKKRQAPEPAPQAIADTAPRSPAPVASYKCDGRTQCSHMTSCEEATWFLRNCPGTKMDGNNDGVPCERQWCK